jgi:hypothetical protein
VPDRWRIEGSFRWNSPSESVTRDGELFVLGQLRVRVGSEDVLMDSVALPYRRPVWVRVAWHTSGQLHLALEGRLIAYDPQVAAGQSFTVGLMTFGDPLLPPGPFPVPRYSVNYISVRVLRENDIISQVLGEIAGRFPPGPEDQRCRTEILVYVKAIIARVRAFVRLFVPRTSTTWREVDTPGTSPFQRASIRAHEHGLRAFSAFMRFWREGDEAASTEYLTHIGAFLSVLRDTLLADYETMLADLESIPRPPERCLELSRAWTEENGDILAPLVNLADETVRIARTASGGGS